MDDNFKTVTSPSGTVYPADQELAPDYWSEDAKPSPWAMVGRADMDGNLRYAFDEIAIFQHKDSADIIGAHDAGCSCPTPFENYPVERGTFLTSLSDFDTFVAQYEVLSRDWGYNDEEEYVELSKPLRQAYVVDQIVALRKTVEDLLG